MERARNVAKTIARGPWVVHGRPPAPLERVGSAVCALGGAEREMQQADWGIAHKLSWG
jgi:hypothetical protein